MKSFGIAGRMGVAVAALAGVLVLAQPDAALARGGGGGGGGGGGHGGGGFGGGGHGGFGGGHGGFGGHGFGGGGFHGGGFHDHDRGFFGGGFGDSFDYGFGYGDDSDYGSYGYQPYASQYWYYCQNPAGYYPYVAQCTIPWQTVPAG